MNKLFLRFRAALTMLACVGWLFSGSTIAKSATVISGGGTGTFGFDLDADGDIDGSHFGLGVIVGRNFASGHFECLMAGNTDILGLPLMAVRAGGTENSEPTPFRFLGGTSSATPWVP